jgi:D-sedoheptulose 7-phosphate isomerase
MKPDIVKAALLEAHAALECLMSNDTQIIRIHEAGTALADALEQGRRVISCGNGGSMCDAMHFAEELSGRFREDRIPFAADAISDPSYISCVANDFGYDQVFARYVQGHGQTGDVLVAISTSGSSASVVAAARAARDMGIVVIALTGRPGSELEKHADISICTPGGRYADRSQELHIKVIHILIELVENHFYIAAT